MLNFTSALNLIAPLPALLFVGLALWQRYRPLRWHVSEQASLLAFASVAVALGLSLSYRPSLAADLWIEASPLRLTVLTLVAFLGAVLLRYSARHLAGDPKAGQFHSNLLLTLASVSLVVVSNHLLILLAAWTAISLSLHQLLLFYPERPRALLAAQKKFILARLAEIALLVAFSLLAWQHDSWLLSEINQQVKTDGLTVAGQIAAVLIALAALVKCAQMPVHGWLIQVVEAPTPVSALLHAGIINLGGFLLILFAPLLQQAALAQGFVLVVAGLTTVLASLVMGTRISAKVRLAWSTSAQMGLMLVECALGLYELALLHLVAHACYKAHAFLNAGEEVLSHVQRRRVPAAVFSPGLWLGVAGLMMLVVGLGHAWLAPDTALSPWLLLGFSMTVLLVEGRHNDRFGNLARIVVGLPILLGAYVMQARGSALMLESSQPAPVADLWIVSLWLGFGVLAALAKGNATSRWIVHFRESLYAGFYLDEWFTRATLKCWPRALRLRGQTAQRPQFSQESSS